MPLFHRQHKTTFSISERPVGKFLCKATTYLDMSFPRELKLQNLARAMTVFCFKSAGGKMMCGVLQYWRTIIIPHVLELTLS